MKTYILRDPNSVEPQKAQFVQWVQSAAASGAIGALFVGLDVHNDSIAVSLAPADATVRVTAPGSTESE
jgi:hypothetical protein